jgi:hypothetical protein
LTVDTDLRARREAIVREHAEAENRHEFDAALEAFHHPRYELMPLGEVIDGGEAVMAYYRETREAFPDQRNRVLELHHAEESVVMELELTGTHLGIAHDPQSLRGRVATVLNHPLTIGRALLRRGR